MPVQTCRKGRKPGFKFGAGGFCYTYTAGNSAGKSRARNKAVKQGSAIKASQAGVN